MIKPKSQMSPSAPQHRQSRLLTRDLKNSELWRLVKFYIIFHLFILLSMFSHMLMLQGRISKGRSQELFLFLQRVGPEDQTRVPGPEASCHLTSSPFFLFSSFYFPKKGFLYPRLALYLLCS